jgi:hypothetical protein
VTLEIRVPISPTSSFLNRVVLLAASIRRYYPDTIVRAYIGQTGGFTSEAGRCVEQALANQNIDWQWVPGRLFDQWSHTRSPFLATMNMRWHPPVDGDHVLIVDADVIFTGPLTELFAFDSVVGVQAHISPLTNEQWKYLFAINGCPSPEFEHVYSGAGIMGPEGQKGPYYVNSGFFFAPRHLFERMCAPYQEAVNICKLAMRDSYWFDQLALALAVAKSGVPHLTLPISYNFPNQAAFDTAYPGGLLAAKVLHYLRTDIIDRDRDFADLTAIKRLVARTDLTGSNEIVRQTVAETMGCLEPPDLNNAENAPWA